MTTPGYLGIDAGTQGLSIVFTDQDLNVMATGEGVYEMVPGLAEGNYEQQPHDWESSMMAAIVDLRLKLAAIQCDFEVLGIGIAGQMHGEVLADEAANSLGPARLWCDSRNEDEGAELTDRFGVKMPKRITAARWLWTIRNHPERAAKVARITTPAGWLAYGLTGQWNLGIGDAAGMFPIDQQTHNYDRILLQSFDALVANPKIQPLAKLLPTVRRAGEDGGALNEQGAKLLGLPIGIPVAPAEGDQPASLAGSLIGAAGLVSVSFGTSVCANSVGDRPFKGVSNIVDHFCAPDGKPINMIFLRNGTTFMNTVVEMFGSMLGNDRHAAFDSIMPAVLKSAPDCGGLLALPFMDDEPGLGVSRGGAAMLTGLNPNNANPGNAVKAALLSTMFNLRLGSEVLDGQRFPRTEMVLSGGLTRTPELAQILADVFNTPVVLPESASEGCAWGAALMAKFRHVRCIPDSPEASLNWESFLAVQPTRGRQRFSPIDTNVQEYEQVYTRYRALLKSTNRSE